MNMVSRLSFAACLLAPCVYSFAGPLELYMQQFAEKQYALQPSKSIEEVSFNQLVDHQHPEKGTFAQRYFLDNTYREDNDSPIFFYICGEGACAKRYLSGAIRTYAKIHHATLIALEHRYYGESLPVNTFSSDNLRYLSTQAAIDDLAYFQQEMTKTHQWKGKWVAFGGSYAGSLAAYYRLKHPELVVGALASSGPVMAKEDFIEYDQHVTKVAGLKCATQMRDVVKKVEESLSNPKKLDKMKALFSATEIEDSTDFLYLIADTGATAIQYGMKDKFCEYLDTHETPLQGYADFANYLYQLLGVTAVDITAQGAMSEETKDYTSGVGMRQWYYQSCKEYGYWQNAHPNPEESSRSAFINLAYHQHICERLFGKIDPTDTSTFNQQFYFPLLNDSVSHIYFTNGSTDPWSKLSLTLENQNATNPKLTYKTILGAAHCDDLASPRAQDSEALHQARAQMKNLLDTWLK